MKERLVIKNFGPIQEVDLELGKMTVLIGDQATGKTTIAKVLAVCRYFSFLYDNNSFIDGLTAWGLKESLKANSYVAYVCEKYSLVFDNSVNLHSEGIDLNSSKYGQFPLIIWANPDFERLMGHREAYHDFDDGSRPIIPPSFFQDYVAKVMDNPFYIPTERGLQSIFSLGKSSIQNIADSLFNQFAQLDQISRTFTNETKIEPLDVLYKNVNGHGFVKRDGDDQFYSMYNAASGYQSTIPVVLLLIYYSEIRKKAKHIIIEEPELNLFPKTQKKLMDYITWKVNEFDQSIFISTHSPYILSSLNNLIYANKLGQNNTLKAKVDSIIPSNKWISAENVSVYFLENGVSKNLIDKEEGLISINELDSVSEIVNNEFDQLLALEVEYENGMES